MTVDGAHFDQVLADLDLAARELAAALERDPARWSRGRPGKWTAGQHVEHLAITLAVSAAAWLISGDPVRALAVLVVATPAP